MDWREGGCVRERTGDPGILGRLHVKTYGELLGLVDARLRALGVRGSSGEGLLLSGLEAVYSTVSRELEVLVEVAELVEGLPLFFRELYRMYVGEEPADTARGFRRLLRIARRIYLEHRDAIRRPGGSPREAFRSGVGRLLSLYKRKARVIGLVKKYVAEVSGMPDVSGDYRVVIAGVPQVGKSTLLSKLTRARPVIGSYPFTTRSIIVGHIDVDEAGRIVLIDSPGILDTPLEEKNIVEKRAVLALKHLADHLLFVIDANPSFYYSLEEQLRVLETARRLVEGKPVTLVVNKVDSLPRGLVEEVVEAVESKTGLKPIPVSALLGVNLDFLREELVKAFRAGSQRPL
ncbi:GTPase [Desulfurococcus mucosus]|uniref:GTPase n=1 Tax=Desulfurococcus mucosus TaxID=2275 RepID=UPI000AC0F45D|nr:GTPase [Desulfurococcus mucosus]